MRLIRLLKGSKAEDLYCSVLKSHLNSSKKKQSSIKNTLKAILIPCIKKALDQVRLTAAHKLHACVLRVAYTCLIILRIISCAVCTETSSPLQQKVPDPGGVDEQPLQLCS